MFLLLPQITTGLRNLKKKKKKKRRSEKKKREKKAELDAFTAIDFLFVVIFVGHFMLPVHLLMLQLFIFKSFVGTAIRFVSFCVIKTKKQAGKQTSKRTK